MPIPGVPNSSRPVRLIALMNQKGGVGKTTTTVNLAAAIARSGRPTLVVDLDPQAHATIALGVDPAAASSTVYDLLVGAPTPQAALSAVHDVGNNLFVLPSHTDLAATESELAMAPDRLQRMERVLAALEGRFEFVLIDCPPSLGLLTLNALAAAREVLIPMQAHFLALQGVGKLLETVRALAQSGPAPAINPRLKVAGVVLCMHDTSSTHTKEVVADLDAFFEAARAQDVPWKMARVFRPAIRRNIKLAECPSFGKTIFDYAPLATGAEDYKALADVFVRDWDTFLSSRGIAIEKREAPIVETRPATAPAPFPAESTPG
ncbi:MAG TPA: ParA family protein [Phycisphaerales bacterium]